MVKIRVKDIQSGKLLGECAPEVGMTYLVHVRREAIGPPMISIPGVGREIPLSDLVVIEVENS